MKRIAALALPPVAVKSDMSDFRVGEKRNKPVNHAEPRAENGNDGDLFVDHGRRERRQRSLDRNVFRADIAEGFITHQHGEFGDDLAEFFGVGVHVAQVRDFMVDEGVIENGYVFHVVFHRGIPLLIDYFSTDRAGRTFDNRYPL